MRLWSFDKRKRARRSYARDHYTLCAVSYPVTETTECAFLNGFMVLVVLFYIHITKYTLSGFKIKWSQTQVRRVRLWRAVSDPLPEPPALLQTHCYPFETFSCEYYDTSEVQSFVNKRNNWLAGKCYIATMLFNSCRAHTFKSSHMRLCVLFFRMVTNLILFIVSFPKSSLSHPLDSQVYFIVVHF